jgi:hypothetical protein
MRGLRIGLASALTCLLLTCAALAHAGQNCEDRPLSVSEVARSLDLAQRSIQALDASGAQVAIIARMGQDLSRYNERYSHAALAWRDHPAGRWVVVHLLNDCGTAHSALYNDGLGSFFLTDLYRYSAEIIIPPPAVQQRLAQVLASRAPLRLHNDKYNMLAYAFSTRYQNSNQWLMEMYAAAAAPQGEVETREEAQRWLRAAGFAPGTVHIDAATRLGARMFRANVAFDDHPFGQRMAGQIDTVTVSSVERFLRGDAQARVLELH